MLSFIAGLVLGAIGSQQLVPVFIVLSAFGTGCALAHYYRPIFEAARKRLWKQGERRSEKDHSTENLDGES